MKYFFSLLLLSLAFSACKKKADDTSQADTDDAIIKKYISDHSLNATSTGTGLYVVVTDPGSGESCNANSNVKVSYKGYYTSGTVFDQSGATGITFNLQDVIQGWTQGIPHFKKGGSGVLLIPSGLGYGANGSGSVPANSVLIFDIKLLDVL